jgi:CheY-like chemotaxis protein
MNILMLEDRGSTIYYVSKWVENNGHNVLEAFNIIEATNYWKDRDQVPVDCILLDLQLPMDGLTDAQKMGAEGGTLTGWIWLRDYVLKDTPRMRQLTIIYSDYIDFLKKKVQANQIRGIKLIAKQPNCISVEVVSAFIREISRIRFNIEIKEWEL